MSRKGSANIIRGGSDSRGAIVLGGLFPFLFPPRAIPRDKPGSYASPPLLNHDNFTTFFTSTSPEDMKEEGGKR